MSRVLPSGVRYPVLLATVLASSVLGGCQAEPQPVSPATATLTFGVSFPKEETKRTGTDALIDSLILEAPLSIGWDGTPTGKVIDHWEWQDGGLTLRLHLKQNVKFHDGTPLTTDLAARIINDGLTAPRSSAVSSTLKSVVAENDWVVIRTGRREGFLLSDISTLNFALPGNPTIGTGPFVLESREPIRLRANADYRMGPPLFGTLQVKEYDTQRAAWAAMMRGDVDVLYDLSSDAVEFVEAEAGIRTYSSKKAYYNLLLINLKHPILGRREVRKALNEAVDRDEIVRFALKGHGTPAVGPVWTDHYAFDAQINQAIQYAPDRAAARLDGEGLKPGRSVDPGEMPSRFAFDCLFVQDDNQLERLALVLQKQLFGLGIDMRLRPVSLDALGGAVFSGQYEAALINFASTRSLSFVYTFWHSPGEDIRSAVPGTYAGADSALDELRAALTEPEIRAAVPKVQRAFVDDPPAVILDWLETSRAVRRSIDVPAEPGRDVMGSLARWKPAGWELASR